MLRPVLLCIVLLHCFNISSANDEESSSCQAAATLSCEDIKNYWPESSSGYYNIIGKGNERRYMYCDMKELELAQACGSGKGWTRLAYLDMSNATQNCPSGFGLYQSGGVRACGKPSLFNGCVSVQFPSNGISYSQICGRVTGYVFGSINALFTDVVTDAEGVTISRGPSQQHVWTLIAGHSESTNSSYSCPCNTGSSVSVPDSIGYVFGSINALFTDVVTNAEGVTISHGPSQQHVWTLIAGHSESTNSSYSCPCNTGSSVSVPASIGNNYFCESGNPYSSNPSQILYTSDPLWDGQGCGGAEGPCCNVP
ncbi:PREDICTED: uncharacterized protein LOC109589678, partial [Amphimedon queenslandica]|uniref:Uncharacterized protein n=1 Tax=Amphimedon queenslandica TaxID=400682 RepID=A0AAN0JW38_AMPQE